MDLPIPHIYDENTTIREQEINLRQTTSSQLPFVTIVEETGQSTIHIDAEGVQIGDYQLELESFDALGTIQPTLMTDIIQISVKQSVSEPSEPQTLTLESQLISAVIPSSWNLDLGSEQASEV